MGMVSRSVADGGHEALSEEAQGVAGFWLGSKPAACVSGILSLVAMGLVPP
jgi:hypothetical protein